MNFSNKLVSKINSITAQSVYGIHPLVVQAVENLFPDTHVQKTAYKYILEIIRVRMDVADAQTLLALLHYSEGDLDKFRKAAWQSHPHFWMDEIRPIFGDMKDAEDWVKSISIS